MVLGFSGNFSSFSEFRYGVEICCLAAEDVRGDFQHELGSKETRISLDGGSESGDGRGKGERCGDDRRYTTTTLTMAEKKRSDSRVEKSDIYQRRTDTNADD